MPAQAVEMGRIGPRLAYSNWPWGNGERRPGGIQKMVDADSNSDVSLAPTRIGAKHGVSNRLGGRANTSSESRHRSNPRRLARLWPC